LTGAHAILGAAVAGLFAASGLLGAWRWYRVQESAWFWRLLRAGQVALLVEVALGAGLMAAGHEPVRELHLLYGLLPLGVLFAAEQLRLSAAATVLEARGLDDAQAVGELAGPEQRSVVVAILRRELGAMAAGALVAAALALRAGFI
jgi:hypothetical protein